MITSFLEIGVTQLRMGAFQRESWFVQGSKISPILYSECLPCTSILKIGHTNLYECPTSNIEKQC